MPKTFDTTPTARHLIALASQKWNPTGAIGELVDNSFGKARGNANKVIIVYDRRDKTLAIVDDGVGMDRIGRLFQLGNTIGYGPGDIGKYGSGGTMALLWLPTEVTIHTLRDHKVMTDHIVWGDYLDQYPQVSDEWHPASIGNTPSMLLQLKHGTMIKMKLRPTRGINADIIQRELARIYAPGLRHGKKIEWITITAQGRSYEQTLRGDPFDLPDDQSKIVRFNITIQYGHVHLPVKGTVALIEDLPYKDSVVAIGYGSRVIMTTRDCYESQDGETSYTGTGVAGWLDLGEGWQDYLSTTKDAFNDDVLRSALMQHIFKQIEPLLKQTDDEKLSIILDGIALDLSDALNGVNDVDTEFLGSIGAAGPGLLREDGLGGKVKPFKPIDATPEVVDPARAGPYPGADAPPATRLNIIKVSDQDMNGALCRMGVVSDQESNLQIEVNKDHEIVEELLVAKPIHKLALLLMITREIASALSAHPGLLKRIVAKKLQTKLDALPEDARERVLARLLMDSARRPRLEGEAA